MAHEGNVDKLPRRLTLDVLRDHFGSPITTSWREILETGITTQKRRVFVAVVDDLAERLSWRDGRNGSGNDRGHTCTGSDASTSLA
jgi:hypothetical protein